MEDLWRDVFNGRISYGKNVMQETKFGMLASAKGIQPILVYEGLTWPKPCCLLQFYLRDLNWSVVVNVSRDTNLFSML